MVATVTEGSSRETCDWLQYMPGFTPSTIMNPDRTLECNTLTMNSVTALMASHTIVNPNRTGGCKTLSTKQEHQTLGTEQLGC
jgi:hypothetical protein